MKLTPRIFLDMDDLAQLGAINERGEFLFRWACDEWCAAFFVLDGWFVMIREDESDGAVRLIPIGTEGLLYGAMLHALDEAITLEDLGMI